MISDVHFIFIYVSVCVCVQLSLFLLLLVLFFLLLLMLFGRLSFFSAFNQENQKKSMYMYGGVPLYAEHVCIQSFIVGACHESFCHSSITILAGWMVVFCVLCLVSVCVCVCLSIHQIFSGRFSEKEKKTTYIHTTHLHVPILNDELRANEANDQAVERMRRERIKILCTHCTVIDIQD